MSQPKKVQELQMLIAVIESRDGYGKPKKLRILDLDEKVYLTKENDFMCVWVDPKMLKMRVWVDPKKRSYVKMLKKEN